MSDNRDDIVKGGRLSRPFTFDRVVRLLLTCAGIVAFVWVVDLLRGVLLPFAIAWLIAYMLEPVVQYNKRLLGVRRRWLPILITLFECVLVVGTVCIFVVPPIIEQTHQVATFVTNYAQSGASIPFVPESIHSFLREKIDFDMISRHLTRQDMQTILSAVGNFISGGYDVVMSIFSYFVVLLYVVFIMLDYDALIAGFRRLVPPRYREVVYGIADDVKNSMNHYFRGQALVAFIVGVLFCIGFSIVGLPMAIVLGLFIGLLNMVPYLQLISLIPTTLLCLVMAVDESVQFWPVWWECMAVYAVVQVIQDLFLTPKIMGKVMGLNPAIILLSLSIWGSLMGFIGLIIALPMTTLLISYYERFILKTDEGNEKEG